MTETDDDKQPKKKQKTLGAFLARWLKLDDKAALPRVLWRELLGSLLVVVGATGSLGLGALAGLAIENTIARVAVWVVVTGITCFLLTLPGKAVLKETRSVLAAGLLRWLGPWVAIGVIVAGIAWSA